MKKTVTAILLVLVALSGRAQEMKMIEPTFSDYISLLKAKGYVAYSFDTKDFKNAQVEPVVMD